MANKGPRYLKRNLLQRVTIQTYWLHSLFKAQSLFFFFLRLLYRQKPQNRIKTNIETNFVLFGNFSSWKESLTHRKVFQNLTKCKEELNLRYARHFAHFQYVLKTLAEPAVLTINMCHFKQQEPETEVLAAFLLVVLKRNKQKASVTYFGTYHQWNIFPGRIPLF